MLGQVKKMRKFKCIGETMTIRIWVFLVFLVPFGTGQIFASPLQPLSQHGPSTILITKFIDRYHYKASQLNDERSSEVLDEYIDALDSNRHIFTLNDIEGFKKYQFSLDNALLDGDLVPAFTIFQKFNERRIERANYALQVLEEKFDFSVDETYQFDREEASWPKDKAALNELWRKRVKNDYLTLLLSKKEEKEIRKTLRKRYERLISRSDQFKAEDAYEIFINAYLRSIEPHTAYLSPRTSENFTINMSLSLEGIGAALQMVDDYTVVKRIIPGGPASISELLHIGDKIIGVGQGVNGKVEDVVGWRLDDVVEKIRGPKDSIVQLHITPKHDGLDGPDRYITLVRNKIKLEDQKVKKSIIEIPGGGNTRKIGVLDISMFYKDFAAFSRGEKDYSSTTRDAKLAIDELKAENVDGLVVDLRGNGGGSLDEAVELTGLFIKSGPVVQIRKSSGEVDVSEDEDNRIAYTGPLVVLVDRHSASASEIFAGAMQDYGRGVIVGEPTFGKGTVQSVVDLNRYARGIAGDMGRLKLTMAQFFRVNGESTQHRGVVPDIVYPTAIHDDEQGERSLKHALPWVKIAAAKISPVNSLQPNIAGARIRHEARVKQDEGFRLFLAQAEIRKKLLARKTISLLESERKIEREKTTKSNNERLNKFRLSRGLAAVSLDDDNDNDEVQEGLKDELKLVGRREAAEILVDLYR